MKKTNSIGKHLVYKIIVPTHDEIKNAAKSFYRSDVTKAYLFADEICHTSKGRFDTPNPFQKMAGSEVYADIYIGKNYEELLKIKKNLPRNVIFAGHHGLAVALATGIKLLPIPTLGLEKREYKHIIPVTNDNKDVKDFGLVVKYLDPKKKTIKASPVVEMPSKFNSYCALVFRTV